MIDGDIPLTVSDFVAFANQTLEFSYPTVIIEGELANFRVSKNKWVYFDLKDELASLRFFGTVYTLNGPLEDGMMLRVRGTPRLHSQYGFSVTVQQIELVGEGTIKRAAHLLQEKLAAEGLFDLVRKRELPYPPKTVGLITSDESAAYADFVKVLNARWGGISIQVANVQVQGVGASQQIVTAIEAFNQHPEPPEVLVLIRGGGSPEDLQAFSDEPVVRAVAASRIPTMVAIGHEIDTSLAELAADLRASTPSNAAEMLVPDRREALASLQHQRDVLIQGLRASLEWQREALSHSRRQLNVAIMQVVRQARRQLFFQRDLLRAFDPTLALARGYAIVRAGAGPVRSASELQPGSKLTLQFHDGTVEAVVQAERKQHKS